MRSNPESELARLRSQELALRRLNELFDWVDANPAADEQVLGRLWVMNVVNVCGKPDGRYPTRVFEGLTHRMAQTRGLVLLAGEMLYGTQP